MDKSDFAPHHIGAVTLQQIRCFVAVARRKSYGGLAAELGIEQPAVSRAVMRLEEILGAPLFEPGARTKLTGFGEKVYEAVGSILGSVESLKLLALDEAGKGRATGTVTIGAKSIFAETLLPGLIGKFRAKHRRAAVRVRCGSGESLLNMLRSGEIDFAISHRRPMPGRKASGDSGESGDIAFKRMWTFPRLLIMPPKHRLRHGRMTPAALAAAGLILPGKHTRTHAEIMQKLARSVPSENLKGFIEVTSAEAQIRYVAKGLGVAVIDGSARGMIPAGLAARPVPAHILAERDAGVYYLTGRYIPRTAVKFMQIAFGFTVEL